jgi:hypothetical protein
MADQHQHRRRRSSRSHGGSSSKAKRSWALPAGTALVKLAAGVAASIVLILVLIVHFNGDALSRSPSPSTEWPADGTAPIVQKAEDDLAASPSDPASAVERLKQALAASPLNIAALSMLAEAQKLAGRDAESDAAYQLVLDRSRRNLLGLVWLARKSADKNDYSTLVDAADAFLRANVTYPRMAPVYKMLTALATEKAALPDLVDRLRQSPPWRQGFLNDFAKYGDTTIFPEIMAALDQGGTAPKVDEEVEDTETEADPAPEADPTPLNAAWRYYLNRLVQIGQSREAYAMWVGLLPPEQAAEVGYIFNGSFESPPMGIPFDWTLTPLKGVQMGIDSGPVAAGNKALALNFGGGSIKFANVSQILLLGPGRYQLTGQVRTDSLDTPRGLQWRVLCQDGQKFSTAGESDFFRGTRDWSQFGVDVTIPETGCDSQLLRLDLRARIPAEQKIKGRVWFDALAIERQPADAAPPEAGG